MSKTCTYFFPPQSPWAYLGHQRLVELAKRYDVQINLKPVDLAKVFAVSGGLPLQQRPLQRQAYRLVELKRWSEHLDLPLTLQPKFFPVPGDAAACLIIATRHAHGTDAALALTSAIMHALWAEERNIADKDTLAAIASTCGFDGKTLMKSSETALIQEEYKGNTDEAVAANVFGAPWYIVDGESFWGQDRLEFVEKAFAK